MALRVGVQVIVSGMDGSPLADAQRISMTFNVRPDVIEDEVPLAVGLARRAFEGIVAEVEGQMIDWATATRKVIDASERLAAEQQRRRELGEDDS